MFVVRRIVFVVLAVYIDQTLIYQILLLINIQMSNLVYQGLAKPGSEKYINKLDLFNEFMILTTSDCTILFTAYVEDLQLQHEIGWFWIGLVLLCVLVNLSYIIYHSLRSLSHVMTKYCNRAYAVQKNYKSYIDNDIMQKHKRPTVDQNNQSCPISIVD